MILVSGPWNKRMKTGSNGVKNRDERKKGRVGLPHACAQSRITQATATHTIKKTASKIIRFPLSDI
jgi:hypothetical protein